MKGETENSGAQGAMREFLQAEALRDVRHWAQQRRNARYHEREATTDLHTAVVAALDSGATTRRVQELSGLSLATINRWKKQPREDYHREIYTANDPLVEDDQEHQEGQ